MTTPLRELTKGKVGSSGVNNKVVWEKRHALAFDAVKRLLSANNALSYFDMNLETELIVDASPVGLGAILVQKAGQEVNVVSYASRALSNVEQRYPQVHRESLALVWGILHFAVYLRGSKPFTVSCDNRSVVHIFNSASSSPPPRIERMLMKVQQFCFKVVHKSGKDNPADYLSRHPELGVKSVIVDEEEHYVNFLARASVPKSMSLEEVAQASRNDPVLRRVMFIIQNRGHWTLKEKRDEKLLPFYLVRNELSVSVDPAVLLKNRKLVIPESLQARVLELAHIGHQGIGRTKEKCAIQKQS